MNTKTVLETVTIAFAVSLLAVQSIGNVFADDDTSDDDIAASEVNDCGNGSNPIDVFCQNVNSQIQGRNNDGDVFGRQDSPSDTPP